MPTRVFIASQADVLKGSSRIPVPLTVVIGTGTRGEPLRTSAWEARIFTVAMIIGE